MTVITINGKQDTGKTTSIKNMIRLMLLDKASILWESDGISSTAALITRCGEPHDMSVVLKYKGKVIAITTQGDYPQKTTSNLVQILMYTKAPIDIFVCASHNIRQIRKMLTVSYGTNVITSPSISDFNLTEISKLEAMEADVQKRYTHLATTTNMIVVLPKKAATPLADEKAENEQSAADLFDLVKALL